MRLSSITLALSAILVPVLAQDANTTYLVAPALVTNSENNTVFECWKLKTPFKRSSVPGVSGTQVATISNNTNLAYTILPPRYNGGLHTAPVAQLVHFLSGVAHLTLPQDNETELWIVGGKGGLLFAVDTTGQGHFTNYPTDQETVALVAPFEGGRVPEYEVLNEGPCHGVQTFI
ncbi:hypothetical protein BKA66DRAFT_514069 [Pyrenochaeta sp. MPI-SDFR-AT-0127]|nr:hypothetical protein BKA66DRAFT_514069 [Pyrenochaeta sp. MPI-SDFR-AT-0127]